MKTPEDILRHEFSGGDDSFLIQLRTRLHWDKAAFTRLTTALLEHAQATTSDELLDRELAMGYWYVENFVNNWTAHENFPRPESPYYEDCLTRLNFLASYYFTGQSPYEDDSGFVPL